MIGLRLTGITLLKRLTAASPEGKGQYDKTSQDVLIPAFFAAYSGQPVEKAQLSPFYSFPLPNWTVAYNGLSGLEFIKKKFSAFTINHSYSSTYSVGNFTSNLDYGAAYVNLAVQNFAPGTIRDQSGQLLPLFANQLNQYVPIVAMSTITMSEKFQPLIGVQLQTKSRINGRVEYSQSRDVALSLSNSQVAEFSTKDLMVSLGFTKQKRTDSIPDQWGLQAPEKRPELHLQLNPARRPRCAAEAGCRVYYSQSVCVEFSVESAA